MKRSVAIFLLSAFIVATSLGCRSLKEKIARKATEKALEEGTGEQWTLDKDKVTVTDTKGHGSVQFGAGASVPDDWPKDVPVYPGAKVTLAIASKDTGSKGYALTLESKDSPKAVHDYYKSKLSGYTVALDAVAGDMHMLSLRNAATGSDVTVNTAENKGNATTTIQLFAGKK